MSLIDHLQSIASAWSEQTGRSLARLSTIVLNDGKFFDRLAAGKTCTVDSYERFVGWLADPANWPDAMIPDHVRPLLPVVDTDNSKESGRLASASDTGDTDSVSSGVPTQQEVAA